ncbi:MAG: hypothetical protein JO187_03325, partial [Acidobacteria bacterium]|nr:hypothetical protein [Acidobacteriota bacterium]
KLSTQRFALEEAHISRELTVSRPEGFAYYALHPLSYGDVLQTMQLPARIAVLGIRSIGTTLSAVVASAARQRGHMAQRITVRPIGDAWDRKLHVSTEQREWIANHLRVDAQFLVVDEGPGLSGSSFLAVGEALVREGVPLEKIMFLCSTEPDVEGLRAPDGRTRWRRFDSHVVKQPSLGPSDAADYFAEGRWRESLTGEWPGSWYVFERVKFRGSGCVFKFEGLGEYGSAVMERAQALAAAGFSPALEPAGDGFVRYEWLRGRIPQQASVAILDRIAEYCAWRSREFAVSEASDLGRTMSPNFAAAFGSECDGRDDLPLERVVIPDGKMQPYEWLETDHGLMKLDSADHGDDHFYPGPTDIAWDLAGTIIEWRLDAHASEYLLTRYAQLSGDTPRNRIHAYVLAYTLFRFAYCRLGSESLSGTEEERRLARDAERYRAIAQSVVALPLAA